MLKNFTCNVKNLSTRNFLLDKKVSFLGAPLSDGQSKKGTELGPDALRNYGLIEKVKNHGFNIKDYGNLKFKCVKENKQHLMKNASNVFSACKILSNQVNEITKNDEFCLTVGGDHSLGLGTVHGHRLTRKNLSIIWIDAHADINSMKTTNSGNAHGMPVSFLIDAINNTYNKEIKDVFEKYNLSSCISSDDIVFIGLRDIEPCELDYLKKYKINYFTMKEIDQMGIEKVLKLALDAVSIKQKDSPLHVSFDVDSLDPLYIPSTGTAVFGGLSCREAFFLGEMISETKRLKALDIFELNPLIGTKENVNQSLLITSEIILSFLGKQRNTLLT